jgi:hypothetical protein
MRKVLVKGSSLRISRWFIGNGIESGFRKCIL